MGRKRKNQENNPGDEEMRLEAILDYEMDELESKAYKLCLMWLDRSRKIFPDYEHSKMKKGDPRKSLIFKLCYKLVRETQGVLDEADYSLYVRAQLEILKHITNGQEHPMIDANCLVGEKAWIRWKLWKKKYDARLKVSENSVQLSAPETKVTEALVRTKEFLVKAFGGQPTPDKFREAVLNRNLLRWINTGKISPYYLAMSPYVERYIPADDLKRTNFDMDVYRPCLTPGVKQKFQELFDYEFEQSITPPLKTAGLLHRFKREH